ncbi:unnamed protein product, partial [Heterosigma akashiwo]
FEGYCYHHNIALKTWHEAEDACQEHAVGGHLASIHSSAENEFMDTLCDAYCDGGGMKQHWLGGFNEVEGISSTNVFWEPSLAFWSDKTKWDYTNWEGGEPNNYGTPGEHCLTWGRFASDLGLWNDLDCSSSSLPSFCK